MHYIAKNDMERSYFKLFSLICTSSEKTSSRNPLKTGCLSECSIFGIYSTIEILPLCATAILFTSKSFLDIICGWAVSILRLTKSSYLKDVYSTGKVSGDTWTSIQKKTAPLWRCRSIFLFSMPFFIHFPNPDFHRLFPLLPGTGDILNQAFRIQPHFLRHPNIFLI